MIHTTLSIEPVAPEILRAGQVLRDARKRQGLTLEKVGERTGLHASSISRLERGADRRFMSRASLEALADVVRIEGRERLELFRPLGLPPGIERDLAAPEIAAAFDGAQLLDGTYAALRHRHLARVASRYAAGPATRWPVDPASLLRAHRIQVHDSPGQRPLVRHAGDVWIDARGSRHRRRFLVAHAAGHHALSLEGEDGALTCSLPEVSEIDMSANALAWHFLLPGDLLRDRVMALGDVDPWDGDAGGRWISEVAEAFDVPFMAACSRLAEEGLIAEMCGLNEP